MLFKIIWSKCDLQMNGTLLISKTKVFTILQSNFVTFQFIWNSVHSTGMKLVYQFDEKVFLKWKRAHWSCKSNKPETSKILTVRTISSKKFIKK